MNEAITKHTGLKSLAMRLRYGIEIIYKLSWWNQFFSWNGGGNLDCLFRLVTMTDGDTVQGSH